MTKLTVASVFALTLLSASLVGCARLTPATLLGDIFAGRGPLAGPPTIETYRSPETVDAALKEPLVIGANANTLGTVTIYRPGLGNTAPGPAFIARLAMYSDKVIIAYANRGSGEELELRTLSAAGGKIDRVDMPAAIAQKLFVIGSPANEMISWEIASNVFFTQLEAIQKNLPIADFSNARLTVVAHSQGGLDTLTTKKRLINEGSSNVIGDIYTLNTPFAGSPLAAIAGSPLATKRLPELAAKFAEWQEIEAVRNLNPDYVRETRPNRKKPSSPNSVKETDADLITCAVTATTAGTEDGKRDLRGAFKATAEVIASEGINDGLVTQTSQSFGAWILPLSKSYDHAGIAEDWRVVDAIVAGTIVQRRLSADSD